MDSNVKTPLIKHGDDVENFAVIFVNKLKGMEINNKISLFLRLTPFLLTLWVRVVHIQYIKCLYVSLHPDSKG